MQPTLHATHLLTPNPNPPRQLLLAFGVDDAGRMVGIMRRELASPSAAADPHGTFTTYAMDRCACETEGAPGAWVAGLRQDLVCFPVPMLHSF